MNDSIKNKYIYHITHIKNLPGIVAAGGLYSDAERIRLGLDNTNIGMNEIKRRRLSLPVDSQPDTKVGQYVPFFFCPRSVMLYIISMGNHPSLTYTGGQGDIIHLAAKLEDVIDWAEENNTRWAFTATNAGARYSLFYSNVDQLDEINWKAVNTRDFRNADIQEGKQAEFLIYGFFPLKLVTRIGVQDRVVCGKVSDTFSDTGYEPDLAIEPTWYF